MTIPSIVKGRLLLATVLLSFPVSFAYFFISGDWSWLLYAVIVFQINKTFGNSIAMHRYFGHNSFKTGPIRHKILAFWTILLASKSPITYAMNHRHHHLFADTPTDTHNPNEFFWGTLLGTWEFHDYAWFQNRGVTFRCRDLARDPTLVWIERHYYTIWLALIVITTAISWKVCLFLLLLPAGYFHIAAGMLNTFGHVNVPGSYRNYNTSDKSQNHWLWALIAGGEGFQNNHHMYPTSANFAVRWFEIDPTYWIAKIFFITKETKIIDK